MEQTPKYGLKKPGGSDYGDVAVLNENVDKIDAALNGLEEGKAGLDPATGKVKPELLPPMNYDPAGSAAAVEVKLGQHTGSKANPHGVTAPQVGAIPTSQKGTAGGVAPLGADNLVPVSHLPSQVKERRVVGTIAERNAITDKFSGLQAYVKDATADPTVKAGGADYLWDGAAWIKTGEAESMDVVTRWENVTEKPTTFPPSAHTHPWGDVTGKPGTFAPSAHTHPISDVTGALKQFGPVNVTIPVGSWSGAGPWTQNVAVSGVLAAWDWKLKLSLQKQTVTDTRKAQEKAVGCVTYCETYNGGVTLTCYEKKPEVGILAVLSGEV